MRAVFFSCIALVTLLPVLTLLTVSILDDELDEPVDYSWPRRVPLEAHIMSKCPDARDCLHDLVLPAMVNISDYVDFKLSFIGT